MTRRYAQYRRVERSDLCEAEGEQRGVGAWHRVSQGERGDVWGQVGLDDMVVGQGVGRGGLDLYHVEGDVRGSQVDLGSDEG